GVREVALEAEPTVTRSPYWLTRFVLLRLLGFVYFIAFLCLARQLLPLLGHDGLTPVPLFLHRLEAHFGSRRAASLQLPSLFWLDASDGFMLAMACLGAVLSLVVLAVVSDSLLMAVLLALYLPFLPSAPRWSGC